MCRAKVFKYEILETMPLSDLEKYKNHNRLRVFYNKGVTCVNCELTGTQLALGKGRGGSLHIDVYTDDFYPLTVDHIIPKSKGGSNELSNLNPMCAKCNFSKGNKLNWNGNLYEEKGSYKKVQNESKWVKGNFRKINNSDIGEKVYLVSPKCGSRYREIGTISDFVINPHVNKLQFMIEGNRKSMYSLKRGYIKV